MPCGLCTTHVNPTSSFSGLQVTGLPSGITCTDVLQLFWSWQARVASIHLQPAAIGQCMEAFLEFELSEHAAQAVVQRHGTMVTTAAGIFQLSVQQAGKAEWEAVVAARENSDGIVKVKGVPSKAQIGDVLAFLEVGGRSSGWRAVACAPL